MRSYFNGGGSGSSATPPPSMSGRSRGSTGQIMSGQARSSSASLPRSPESDLAAMMTVGGSSGSGQGSLGSHGSNQEVYVNIYQNTNHPSLFVSVLYYFFTTILYFFFVFFLFNVLIMIFKRNGIVFSNNNKIIIYFTIAT